VRRTRASLPPDVGLPDDFRAESRKRWSDQAAGWESRRDLLRTATMPVSAWMIDAIDPQPGHTVLELAAGTGDTGLLAAELIQPGGTLICSDFSPEMLATARRRAEELGVGNVRFKQIDAETSIDLEAASVDAVLCRWGYMLMADPESALRETRRVLRPGGRVALAAWAGPDENPWSVLPNREMIERGVGEQGDPDAPNQFTWAQEGLVAEHLLAAGFTEHHVEALDFTMDYPSAEDWWAAQSDFSSRFAAALRRAGEEDLAAVRAAVERHAERFADHGGALRIPARTWVAWAAA
jgi:SAM-dependent methyltransferase